MSQDQDLPSTNDAEAKEEPAAPPNKWGIVAPITPETQAIRPTGFSMASLRWHGVIGVEQFAPADRGVRDYASHLIEMPWPMLKAFHQMLGEMIEDHEQEEGTINVPRTFRVSGRDKK